LYSVPASSAPKANLLNFLGKYHDRPHIYPHHFTPPKQSAQSNANTLNRHNTAEKNQSPKINLKKKKKKPQIHWKLFFVPDFDFLAIDF